MKRDRFIDEPPEHHQIESLRLPPHSIEAEQAVIGGLLLRNDAWESVGDLIGERDFYRADHRLIWRVIIDQIEDNKPADVITVTEVLKKRDQVQDAGGLQYIHQLAQGTPSTANIRHYAQIVRDRATLRNLAEVGTAIADAAYSTQGRDARDVLDEAESRILKVGESSARRGGTFQSMSSTLTTVMERLDELHRNPATVTGLATGFVDLDEMTTGLQAGDLIIVAGRPSMGKTAFALNIAEHVAVDLQKQVLVFSMEMSGSQLATRLLSANAKVDAQALRTGRLDPGAWDRMGGALGRLNEAPIHIDDTPALNPMEIRARARRKRREHGSVGLVVIDYLQLMNDPESKAENRATEIGAITGALKSMAKELGCPVILLSQLNRSLESRANKRPVMSDLRDSGAVEQDADLIFFIYRDEIYNDESPDHGIAEIIIGKQRNGPIGTVKLTFLGHHTRFENYAGQQDYGYAHSTKFRGPMKPRRSPLGEKDD